MPTPENIRTKLQELPVLDVYDRPGGENLWEKNEYGGHFHFFRHYGFLWDPETGRHVDAIGCKLLISGSEKSRAAIAADFTEVLGPPRRDVRQEIMQALVGKKRKLDTLTWLQPEDDRVPNTSSLGILGENFAEVAMFDSIPED